MPPKRKSSTRKQQQLARKRQEAQAQDSEESMEPEEQPEDKHDEEDQHCSDDQQHDEEDQHCSDDQQHDDNSDDQQHDDNSDDQQHEQPPKSKKRRASVGAIVDELRNAAGEWNFDGAAPQAFVDHIQALFAKFPKKVPKVAKVRSPRMVRGPNTDRTDFYDLIGLVKGTGRAATILPADQLVHRIEGLSDDDKQRFWDARPKGFTQYIPLGGPLDDALMSLATKVLEDEKEDGHASSDMFGEITNPQRPENFSFDNYKETEAFHLWLHENGYPVLCFTPSFGARGYGLHKLLSLKIKETKEEAGTKKQTHLPALVRHVQSTEDWGDSDFLARFRLLIEETKRSDWIWGHLGQKSHKSDWKGLMTPAIMQDDQIVPMKRFFQKLPNLGAFETEVEWWTALAKKIQQEYNLHF